MKKQLCILLMSIVFIAVSHAQVPDLSWNKKTIKSSQKSSGFLDVIDIDGDGQKEIILSTLMESGSAANPESTQGAIRIFKYNAAAGIMGTWTEQIVLPLSAGLPFINTPQVFDVDGDGHLDIIVQQGFLRTNGGSFQWLKGPDFTQMIPFHASTAPGQSTNFWHESEQFDLDGDGKKDIITTFANVSANPNNFSLAVRKVEWFRNMGNGEFERYTINDSIGGVFIKHYDVNKDGKEDIVVSQFFGPPAKPSLIWLEQVEAPAESNGWEGVWNYHVIDHTTGLGYYFEFYDITGDGQDELVYGNHNNVNNPDIVDPQGNRIKSGIYYFKIPDNPTQTSQWDKYTIDEGFPIDLMDMGNPASQGSPGIFSIGDIDGNGKPDIALPGDGTNNLFIIRQGNDGTFTREVLETGRMWGMAMIADVNGNGRNEVVGSMHNYPGNIFEFINMPAGKLMIFEPVYETTNINSTNINNINFYPNPANNVIYVDNSIISIDIFDLSGRLVLSETIKKETINITDLSKGSYIIKLKDINNNIKLDKLFIQ